MTSRYIRISRTDLYRIAAKAACDWRTVLGVLQGGGRPMTRHAISEAAKALDIKIEIPEPESAAS